MTVSVIMPTYNSVEFISNSIESVLNQTYSDWELLIIDDKSNDGTFDLLIEYAATDDRIKLFSNAVNSGAGVSRNLGLENAKGRFIAFLDSDDLWHEHKLQNQISFMLENSAPISHTSFSFIDECNNARQGSVLVSKEVDLIRHLKRTEIGTSTAIIDRSIVVEPFRFKKIRARQDLALWINLLGLGYTSFGLDECLVKYRVRKGSVSSNKIKMLYVTLFVYLDIKELSLRDKFFCYSSYVASAISKRRR
ncbi:hypothetical protein A143_09710 [Vibrio splendidus ZS-139]|nr:hypothetical protein A143_09710 [Vibrio splendidus ZS-139]